MNHKKQKLELTWIGKNEALKIEPKILKDGQTIQFKPLWEWLLEKNEV